MAAQLDFDRRGDGSPLVLVPGILSDRRIWEPLLGRLAKVHDCISIDLPGFGGSPPLPAATPPTAEAMARHIAGFLRSELGIERPALVGNSLGGRVVLEMARAGDASSVLGLAPGAFWDAKELAYARASIRATHALASRVAPFAETLTATAAGRTLLFGQLIGRPWQVPASEAAHALRAADGPGYAAMLDAAVRGRFERGEELAGTPVTLAWGARDLLLPASQRHRAARLVPHATVLDPLPGCGHIPTWDDPAQVAGIVLRSAAEA